VLVGGGHAHVLVLERWRTRAPRNVELTVVSDRTTAVYSGMIPGVVGGDYAPSDVTIDVARVAERAGARFLHGAVTRIDAPNRRMYLGEASPLEYDVASLDVGSTVGDLGVPGVTAHAVRTRPIDNLVVALHPAEPSSSEHEVVVVGAGAAGVELALALRAAGEGRVTLVDHAPRPLPGHQASVSRRVSQILEQSGVLVRLGIGVAAVEENCVRLQDGSTIDSDTTVWAVGASAHPFLRESGLPVDEHGFVKVNAQLRVQDTQTLFAAGDCASFPEPLPKAGVYAVRQADVLCDNIIARLADRPLRSYRPQADYLTLLNLGDGTAFGTKWGLSAQGRAVWRLKDHIDRKFVRRFRS